MDAVSNGIIMPVTKPCSIAVSVSTFITLLRFRYPQLVPLFSLLLLINKYSDFIVIVTNRYSHITVISWFSL